MSMDIYEEIVRLRQEGRREPYLPLSTCANRFLLPEGIVPAQEEGNCFLDAVEGD